MPLQISRNGWQALFPHAPKAIIDAFVENPNPLDKSGITLSKNRLAYAIANVEHECNGYTIPGLMENINYSAKRMAEVWPNRFSSADEVKRLYGTAPGWQKKAFDHIYGDRMGNRPDTSDGSTYIGRGGPQVTGRDGYQRVGDRCGLDLVGDPSLAAAPEHQPAILAAFWSWKKMNAFADRGDFKGCVKAWNGGLVGLKDRLERLKGNDPIISRLQNVAMMFAMLDKPEDADTVVAEPEHA